MVLARLPSPALPPPLSPPPEFPVGARKLLGSITSSPLLFSSALRPSFQGGPLLLPLGGGDGDDENGDKPAAAAVGPLPLAASLVAFLQQQILKLF